LPSDMSRDEKKALYALHAVGAYRKKVLSGVKNLDNVVSSLVDKGYVKQTKVGLSLTTAGKNASKDIKNDYSLEEDSVRQINDLLKDVEVLLEDKEVLLEDKEVLLENKEVKLYVRKGQLAQKKKEAVELIQNDKADYVMLVIPGIWKLIYAYSVSLGGRGDTAYVTETTWDEDGNALMRAIVKYDGEKDIGQDR